MSQLQEYKCPCCGGAVEFDSTLQKMKCPYCDSVFDVESLKEYDEVLANAKQEDDMQWDENFASQWSDDETGDMAVYVCKSCGGEIIADETTAASACPFCANPVVMMGKLAGELKPDCIIPFKLDKEAAKEGLRRHFEDKWLLPKVFKDESHIDEIKGVYVPFWLFDANAEVDIEYQATSRRHWNDSDYNYTETSYFSVNRSGTLGFENVPVDGSKKMPDDMMESLEPYDFSQAVDFQTAYLAGYFADKYDISSQESIKRANERIKESSEKAFLETTSGYDSVSMQRSIVTLSDTKTRYALLPVWLLVTTWNDQQYTFAMNGQTGKFVGDLPVDNKKYWSGFAIIAIIIALLAAAAMYLFSC